MADREKVIKAIETHLSTDISVGCDDCTYENNGWCTTRLLADILPLLKEQEAVEPIPPTDESDLWKCGNCNHQLFRCTHQRYCDMCGKKVKWDA